MTIGQNKEIVNDPYTPKRINVNEIVFAFDCTQGGVYSLSFIRFVHKSNNDIGTSVFNFQFDL